MSTIAPDELRMVWRGVVSEFVLDRTRLIDFEGAFRVGKTTAALWKVYSSCIEHPGINWLICRYSDEDTHSTLKPPWRAILHQTGTQVVWDSDELCDVFPAVNGKSSRVYIRGLKAPDQTSRYSKLRGKTLAGIYNDQTEELPHDVFLEMTGRLSQSGYPHQILLTPNPPDPNHWLAREFPEDNHILGRKYYSASIYANAHNLPDETIKGLEQAYPPSHPKHRSAVLGLRGLNVIGKPVYGGDPEKGLAPAFVRALHERPLVFNPHLALCEAIDFGKHCPCVVFAQFTPYGGIRFLGGVMGQDLYLEDFLPIVKQKRSEWFGDRLLEVQTCCDPAGSHDNSQGVRENGVRVLQDFGFAPRWKDNSNAPDVRLAMVERLAGYMRRRAPDGEAFGIEVNPDRWVLATQSGVRPWKFLTDGFEAGYVWDDHMISVGSKQMRRPKKDGWYEHGQNCGEYLELNFGGAQPSVEQVERHATRIQHQALRRAQRDVDPYDRQRRNVAIGRGRGGY